MFLFMKKYHNITQYNKYKNTIDVYYSDIKQYNTNFQSDAIFIFSQ